MPFLPPVKPVDDPKKNFGGVIRFRTKHKPPNSLMAQVDSRLSQWHGVRHDCSGAGAGAVFYGAGTMAAHTTGAGAT